MTWCGWSFIFVGFNRAAVNMFIEKYIDRYLLRHTLFI